jgi:hypothetical protein
MLTLVRQETLPAVLPRGHRLLSLFIHSTSASPRLVASPLRFILTCLCGQSRTRLAADGKSAAKGGQRQFSGLIDVYRQTIRTDGILGLYRGFVPSILGICVYRGL